LTGHKLQVAREMYGSGQHTVAAIATTLGVSRASIYRHLPAAAAEQVAASARSFVTAVERSAVPAYRVAAWP
jgi:AcrR family transcriptional regulator